MNRHAKAPSVGSTTGNLGRAANAVSARHVLGIVIAALLFAFPASSSAGAIHKFDFSFDGAATPAGSLENPNGLAIDEASGDVYVADIGHNVVDRFSSSGSYISQVKGTATPAGAFSFANPAALAVDNSSGAGKGDLYVLDSGNNVVDHFSSSGAYLGQVKESPSGPFPALDGVAVGTGHELWVSASDANVYEFDSAGKFLTHYGTSPYNPGPGFAVDSAKHTYFVRGCGCTEKFDSPTAPAPFADLGEIDPGPANSLAVQLATDKVFVDDGSHVAVYRPDKSLAESFGSAELTDSSQGGIAVNSTTGTAYVANPADSKIYTYESLPFPDAIAGPPTNQTLASSTLTGEVDPTGFEIEECFFEYGETEGYGQSAPCVESSTQIGTGNSLVPVHAVIPSPPLGGTYHFRLAIKFTGGEARGADRSLTTIEAPTDARTLIAFDLSPVSGEVRGEINPHTGTSTVGTTYHFEYGTDTSYGHSTATGSALGNEDSTVASQITGLQPDTTYHYRLVTENEAGGPVFGEDQNFATQPAQEESCPNEARRVEDNSTLLPNCRAYELVSPAGNGKLGGNVMTDNARSRAAADGSAFDFTSLQAFSDARGTAQSTDFLSQRSTESNPGNNGWATHAISPHQEPSTIISGFQAGEPFYVAEMSENLTKGLFRSVSPLTFNPSVAEAKSLYTRTDLRTPGPGTYELDSPCPYCEETNTALPHVDDPYRIPVVAGTSSDFSHVVFEMGQKLTKDASSSARNLYESDEGSLSLVGFIPPPGEIECGGTGGPACIAAPESTVGVLSDYAPHVVSEDGSRVIFSADGSVYLREDGQTTVQVNASESANPLGPNAGYQDASVDGKRIFFISEEQLYMYDVDAEADHHLTHIADATGVLGASSDGQYVYFAQVGAGGGIYLWHEGSLIRIGRFDGASGNLVGSNWGLAAQQSRVSPDGQHLLFVSDQGRQLSGYDNGKGCEDPAGCLTFYLYSADTNRLECVSCYPDGRAATKDAHVDVRTEVGLTLTTTHLGRPMSADGRYAFFSTEAPLVANDTNGKFDAYEYDSKRHEVHLLSSGTSSSDSFYMDASANGKDVFIATREPLVGWDIDQNVDIYDVRVDGGFPQPPLLTAPCAAESCRSGNAVSPAPSSSATSSFKGPGNPSPHHRKPKAKKRRHKQRHNRHASSHAAHQGGGK